MTPEPLPDLLDKLCGGDPQAAEQVFLAYEPYLRLLVRRELPRPLRAKFDSADVVQSVWVRLLRGFRGAGWHFASPAQFHAFLVKVTRHRLIDRCRHHDPALRREQPLAAGDLEAEPSSRQPRPSEVAQADDLWQRLLALCPPDHHELLRLKRQGLPLQEIANRTGLHEGSVRRILRQLARQLALGPTPADPDAQ